jgi:hypothetical protein
MLFMIGLEIDLKKIVRAGRVILFAAAAQSTAASSASSFSSASACRWAAASMRCISPSPRTLSRSHHRQGALKAQARRCRDHTSRHGAAGYRRPVLAVQPSLANLQISVICSRSACRRADGGRGAQPLCAAKTVHQIARRRN